MFHQDDLKRAAPDQRDMNASGHKAHWLALAERGFRPADHLDYLIRRTVLEHSPQVRQSLSACPMRSDTNLLSELQAAIGRYLRAEYDLAQPVPERLAALMREVERCA